MTSPTKWTLKPLKSDALDTLYTTRIEKDFPSNERPSLPAMQRHLREGVQVIWLMSDGARDAAYAVCAETNGLALVTLLAVYPDMRGGGHGTTLLALLAAQYAGRRAIVLEVEDPQKATDEADLTIRRKRIAFYERAGYRMLQGIEHISFGVPLLLMAYPLADTIENIRASAVGDLRAMYRHILPEGLWARVTTREMPAL